MVASHQWIIELEDEAATHQFAHEIAHIIRADDVLTLGGDLGVGKTTFARSLIRHLLNDQGLDVPSPTFTLMQVYNATFPVIHADLYRIAHPDELINLDWDETCDGAAVIVEWADKGGDYIPANRLNIEFQLKTTVSDTHRTVVMTAYGTWVERMKQARLVTDFLIATQWDDAERHFMLGDASTRAYERLIRADGQKAILMISPKRPDGPVIRQGKPYSAIAHLAEDMTAFIAIDKGLKDIGLNVPHIHAYDLDKGLAIIEDLGEGLCVDDQGPIADRYQVAIDALLVLHQHKMPDHIDIDGKPYTIPLYDMEALLIEAELFLDWYVPHIAKKDLSSAARATFVNIWRNCLTPLLKQPTQWVLRDYHSPNIIWCAERQGHERIGVIDFQDCVRGHPAYDVVSLLQDARVSVSDDIELNLLAHYVRSAKTRDDFNFIDFMVAYAVLGAQRATKIMGIFARLDQRDHKPHYLAHLPRVQAYLHKNIKHISLVPLREWFNTYLPELFNEPPRNAGDAT